MANNALSLSSLPASVREVWDKKYAELIGSATSDDEELQLIRALRERVRGGLVWTESGAEVMLGKAARWTPAAVRSAAGVGIDDVEANKRNFFRFMAVLGVGMVVVLALIFWPMIFRKRTDVSTTESADAIRATFVAPIAIDAANLRLSLDVPRSLEIVGQPFQVQPGEIAENGGIKSPELKNGTVAWFASPANWLFGASQTLVQSLQVGDQIMARTATGRVLLFVVDSVTDVEPQQIEALAQRRAGLVLFPLPSTQTIVRVVAARYDPSSEQIEDTVTTAKINQVITISGGQLIIKTVNINRDAAGLYIVEVGGEASVNYPAPMLDIEGQMYPAAGGLRSGPFTTAFATSNLGAAQLVVGDSRIDLGVLEPPHLSAQITGVTVENNEIHIQFLLTAIGGKAMLQATDLALVTDNGGEIAPIAQPPQIESVPGQDTPTEAVFPLPRNAQIVRIRLLNQIWEITLPEKTH